MHHHHAIGGQLHVQFRSIGAQRDGVLKSGQRVFRHQRGAAAMGDVESRHARSLCRLCQSRQSCPAPV